MFLLAGAGSAVFWVIGASFFVIGLHATFYNFDALDIMDDQQELTGSIVEEVWFDERFWKTVLPTHRVEITEIFLSLRFYVKSISKFKICHFSTFRASELWLFMSFCTFLEQLNGKNSRFRNFQILQNWFHVKYDWQKNPELSTLCNFFNNVPHLAALDLRSIFSFFHKV